eukprot:9436700-Ditylum_brightwellii.AAC.1
MFGLADDGTPSLGEGGSKAAKTAEKKISSNTLGDAARDRTQHFPHLVKMESQMGLLQHGQ